MFSLGVYEANGRVFFVNVWNVCKIEILGTLFKSIRWNSECDEWESILSSFMQYNEKCDSIMWMWGEYERVLFGF